MLNQDIGKALDLVAMLYGGSALGGALGGASGLFGGGADASLGSVTGVGSDLGVGSGEALTAAPTIDTATGALTPALTDASAGGSVLAPGGSGAGVLTGDIPSVNPSSLFNMGTSGANPLTDYSMGGVAGGDAASAGGGNGLLSGLLGSGKSMMPLMLAGSGLNAVGNAVGAGQQNKNLADYRNAAAWTPERINSLTSGLETNAANIYNKSAAEKKNSVAGNLAELGRGGGEAAQSSFNIDEASREAQAGAVQSGLLSSGAYTPAGLLTGAGAYNEVNPYASSMTGASGMLGNMANSMMMQKLMSQMFGGSSI